MSTTINLEQTLSLRDRGAVLIDARSPAEFAEATIPGAINMPILDDAERAEVGTLYKQVGKADARRRGIALVAPKIPAMVEQAAGLQGSTSLPVVVFCWRGGLRSLALTQFLTLAGIPARQLLRGHKGFRRHVLDFLDNGQWGRLIVLRGLTGVGKTHYLHRLGEAGFPILDLEGLANHRGSAFGNLGLPPQPTQKMFESLVWDVLRKVPKEAFVLAEGESRHIGRVALPVQLSRSLQIETSIWLKADMSNRVRNILNDYPAIDSLKTDFTEPIMALKERLGKKTVNRYLELLDAGKWTVLVRDIMENYYDPLYQHTLPERRIEVDLDPEETAMERIQSAISSILDNRHDPQ